MGNLVPRLPPCKLGVRPSLKGKALGTRLRRRGGGGGGGCLGRFSPEKLIKLELKQFISLDFICITNFAEKPCCKTC